MPIHKLPGVISLFGPFGTVTVKYKDIFDAKQFYEDLKDYFQEQNWTDENEGIEMWETYYGERIAQGGGSKEVWIWWRLMKNPEGAKMTYFLDLDWHFLALGKKELVKDGRKMSLNAGEVEIKIRAYLYPQYLQELEKHGALKHVAKLFNKRIYNKDLEQRKKELYQETYVLQNWMKQWFKMKRYLPYEEAKGFFPSVAWPSHLKE